MKAKVIKAYTDRIDGMVRFPGESVTLTEARAGELSQGGYVEIEGESAKPEGGRPDYGPMSYADLREAAKAAGISPAGKKAELIAALKAL